VRPEVERIKLGYLIGQYPAVNHSYLTAEVRHLRAMGIEVDVAAVSPTVQRRNSS
jgi:hypothetical protein